MVRIFIKLLLIFVLVYTGVSIWYGRLEEKLLQEPVPSVTTDAPALEKKMEILRKPDDYTIIVKRNIFQAVVVQTDEAPKEVEPEELKPTKLKLSLMGTISGKERDARAIISDDAKRQQDIYQVGDSIQGAIIKTIDRGKVVLSVRGKDEILNLKDRKGGGEAYKPSPSDFYQEPPEPKVTGSAGTLEQQQAAPGRRRPVVRPRPVRRPSAATNPRSGSGQPVTER